MDLFAFTNTPELGAVLVRAGVTGVVIDWERRGKLLRQAGADTEISGHAPSDLAAVRSVGPDVHVLCRVNPWSGATAAEVDLAVELGATEVLLPMVRRPEDVDAALGAVDGRCGLGILVETVDAVRRVRELVRRPLSRVYVGLNDLMIDRGGRTLFAALVDGTVDRVAEAVTAAGIPFGVAGLTVPDRGHPVPCRLLNAALARVGASFTFLRRSFRADVAGRDVAVEVRRILDACDEARDRTAGEVAADHAELRALVAELTQDVAG